MPITARQASNSTSQRTTSREFRWDAAGRLVSIGQTDAQGKHSQTASYQYDHRGLRNSKTVYGTSGNSLSSVRPELVEGQTTHYLYSQDKQLLAEVSATGQIQRQYLYLADLPIAVIDSQQGKSLQQSLLKTEHSAQDARRKSAQIASNSEHNRLQAAHNDGFDESTTSIVWADLKTIASIWSQALGADKAEHTAFIHTNHLGAPEAATDDNAQPVWQASYAPFGEIIKASLKTKPVRTVRATVRPELVEALTNPSTSSGRTGWLSEASG